DRRQYVRARPRDHTFLYRQTRFSYRVYRTLAADGGWRPTDRRSGDERPDRKSEKGGHHRRDRAALNRGLMRLIPVLGSAGLDHQWDFQFENRQRGFLHHAAHGGDKFLGFAVGGFEHQFVVHLQQHLCFQLFLRQRVGHADHGAADDVGGCALDRRVDRGAFGAPAHARDFGIDLADMDAPPKQGFDIAVVARELLGRFHVIADAGETLEVFLDVIVGFAARDAELVGETEGGNAVDDAEIDRFGPAAHFGRHAFHRHAEDLRRRHRMDVGAVGEGFAQRWNVSDVREQAQLDLAVVGADELRSFGR